MSKPLLAKSPTGIQGFDEITGGGLPRGRPTLVCGSAGCGKTLMGMEFLVRGATEFNEPGVFMAFEETADDLTSNVASLGFDLESLINRKKLLIDCVHLDPSEVVETGDFDLEGLFIRLAHAIDSIGAKRVVLDTIEALFSGMPNPRILRAEIRRLFCWLKEKGVTAVITGERGDASLTRQGLEEYVSDCVIVLDHRVEDQLSSRRLRVVKYRGSAHGTNEYPFIIDESGFAVLPVTSLGLQQCVSTQRISTGVQRLDSMLGGQGYYLGSSVMVSGTAGTGKSSLSAHFIDAACRRGERAIYFAFEESAEQIIRNMRSIGLDLQPWVKQGLLQFHCNRPTSFGLEMHLALMHRTIIAFQPQVVVVDPLNSFVSNDNEADVKAMLMRLVDFLKMHQITGFFTSLTTGGAAMERTDVAISSLIDTWLLVRDIESSGERNRGLYVLKSRGMAHSNQVREFVLSDQGIQLRDVYIGPSGVLTGAARLSQEASERAEQLRREQDAQRTAEELERKREALEAQIAAMRAEFALQELEAQGIRQQLGIFEIQRQQERQKMAEARSADSLLQEVLQQSKSKSRTRTAK